MNEAVLKWLASSTIGAVVFSALWLAGSMQPVRKPWGGGSVYSQNKGVSAPVLHLAALPPERAASGVMVLRTSISLR